MAPSAGTRRPTPSLPQSRGSAGPGADRLQPPARQRLGGPSRGSGKAPAPCLRAVLLELDFCPGNSVHQGSSRGGPLQRGVQLTCRSLSRDGTS